MKTAIISFTETGKLLADRLAAYLREKEHTVTEAVKCTALPDSMKVSLTEWTRVQFQSQDAVIFVGATGIAVRAIAPFVKSKASDPAVLVIDEQGKYCIPLLSGHLGGANAYAVMLCKAFPMEPVVTTATDLREKWSVDVFARKNGLQIQSMQKAKEISARILAGGQIVVTVEEDIERQSAVMEMKPKKSRGVLKVPRELAVRPVTYNEITTSEDEQSPDIFIGIHRNAAWHQALYLVPKVVWVGIGCRKGTPMEKIEAAVRKVLIQKTICPESICGVATIDLKAEEQGLLKYCKKFGLPLKIFNADELKRAEGEFSASAFVMQVAGVDNVCERSALCACQSGRIIVKKHAEDGVSVALAVKEWRVCFE